MRLSELGERRILEGIIFEYISNDNIFVDEDAFPLPCGRGVMIVNVDTFVESTDAPSGIDYYSIGWKTVTMTFSDVIAKSGLPTYLMCSISAPSNMEIKHIRELLDGIKRACEYYGCKYIGGDFGGSEDLVITGVGIGISDRFIPRSGAKEGDSVWATNEFSVASIALHYLLQSGTATRGIESVLREYMRPKINPKIAIVLRELATAAIDSSDGLAVSLNDIANKSGVAIILDRIPVASEVYQYAKLNNLDPLSLALYCGEEFEIIFTTDKPEETVIEKFRAMGLKEPIKIGYVEKGSGVFYAGKKIPRKGWEHFKSER